jgi:hypothetical protein
MARLQILELPEGSGDDRPPFILVIDQYEPPPYPDEPEPSPFDGVAEKIGARCVLVFEETIDIPANDVPVDPDGYPIKLRIEPDFETFRQQVQEEILYAQGKVTRAIHEARQADTGQESTGRPTHPDGTPYNYSEIVAGGWHHCDGCRTWGQWTADKPHDCPGDNVTGTATDA